MAGWVAAGFLGSSLLLGAPAQAGKYSLQTDGSYGESFELKVNEPGSEWFYTVEYQLDCGGPQSTHLPGLRGLIRTYAGGVPRLIRFDLFQGKTQTRVSLGTVDRETPVSVWVTPFQKTECTFKKLEGRLSAESVSSPAPITAAELPVLARRHSPYLVVREDQYQNRFTDLPLEMVYSIHEPQESGAVEIRYTVFFSDEDSKTRASAIDSQYSRYGRSTDIEWIYKVVLRKDTGEVLRAEFQGGALDAIQGEGDHSTLRMSGDRWPGTAHPILYNNASNNTFSDRPEGIQKRHYLAYHLDVAGEVAAPLAREQFQLSPQGRYMYLVSQREQELEKKSPAKPSDYLFVTVRGRLGPMTWKNINNGAFLLDAVLGSSQTGLRHYHMGASVDRLGEDMHGREAIAGIQVGEQVLEQLEQGKISSRLVLEDGRTLGSTSLLELERAEAFRLVYDSVTGRYEPRALRSSTPDGAALQLKSAWFVGGSR